MNKPRVTVAHSNEGWNVYFGGAHVAHTRTQQGAIDYGKPIAQATQGELTIQGRDGKFREGYSYGNDPRKIQG